MAMNFGNMNGSNNTAQVNKNTGIALRKGSILDLTKVSAGLKRVQCALGWSVNYNGTEAFDLDLSSIHLDENGKMYVEDAYQRTCYFNTQIFHKEKGYPLPEGVTHSEDSRVGSDKGDAEYINVMLDEVSPEVKSILFCVNIFEADVRKQTFGQVKNSYVKLIDLDTNKELCRFELKENASTSTGVTFAKLFRNNSGGWSFEAIGETHVVINFTDILDIYLYKLLDENGNPVLDEEGQPIYLEKK